MSGDDDIFIASSLIADTPEKEKENATPSETPVMIQRSGDKGPRYGTSQTLLEMYPSCIITCAVRIIDFLGL